MCIYLYINIHTHTTWLKMRGIIPIKTGAATAIMPFNLIFGQTDLPKSFTFGDMRSLRARDESIYLYRCRICTTLFVQHISAHACQKTS